MISPRPTLGTSNNGNDVTVVIVAYDHAWCLEDCVNSVLDQVGAASVVIVVDHCPHGSEIPARNLEQAHDQVTVIVHHENRGLPAARNSGLALVATPWVLFLDGDDMLAPGALATLRLMVGEGTAAVAMGRMKLIDRAGRELVDEYSYIADTFEHVVWRHGDVRPAPLSLEALLTRYRLSILGGTLLQTERLRAIDGFDEGRRFWEDVEMITRLLPTCTFAFTEERTILYRVHDAQMSKRARAMYLDRISFSWSVLRRAAPSDRSAVRRGLRNWPRDHMRRSRETGRSTVRQVKFICFWAMLMGSVWVVTTAEAPVSMMRGRGRLPKLEGEGRRVG